MRLNRLPSVIEDQRRRSRVAEVLGWIAEHTCAPYSYFHLCDREESERGIWWGEQHPSVERAASWVASTAQPLFIAGPCGAEMPDGHVVDEAALPLACFPVVAGNAVIGALAIGVPLDAGPGSVCQPPTVDMLSCLVGMTLQNASLEADLSQKEEQMRDLIRGTVDAQEAERERICLEVHDGVAQTLASAFQYLQTAESVSIEDTQERRLLLRASALVKMAIQESREVINSLQPATLSDLGLVRTLQQELRQLEHETRWKVTFDADQVRLPSEVETGLYRIIREAITNVRRHAETTRLHVAIRAVEGRLKIEVKDWGKGFAFNHADLSSKKGTMGLISIHKRAELLQASCAIHSAPGQGTSVRLEMPLHGCDV